MELAPVLNSYQLILDAPLIFQTYFIQKLKII